MKYKVHIILDAEEDLFEIYKYVYLNDSEDKADLLYSKLKEVCNSLENYAERGHVVGELSELGISDFQELHFKPYRIIYQLIDDTVYIHCILDGRRDMQRLLQERLIRNIK